MERITTATKSVDLYGAGKHGFKDGNLGLGISPTDFNAAWCNQVQEELANAIEAASIALNGADRTQLLQAISRLNSRYSGAMLSANTALTAAVLGRLVVVYGNGAPITLTMPDSATCGGGGAINFLNASAYDVTIQRFGADVINPASSNVNSIVLNPGDTFNCSLAGTVWEALGGSACLKYLSAFANSLSGNGYQKFPGGLILQWGQLNINNAGSAPNLVITLPVAWTTGVYIAGGFGNGWIATVSFVSGNTTTLSLCAQTSNTAAFPSSSQPVYWFALGK